jgi:hypothetical protein
MQHQVKWGVLMAQQDQYQLEKTMQFPGMVVRVYRPILTEAERARRMAAIHKEAARLLKKVK